MPPLCSQFTDWNRIVLVECRLQPPQRQPQPQPPLPAAPPISLQFHGCKHLITSSTLVRSHRTMDLDPRQYENIAIKDNDIHSVVLSYLIHNCYKESVESFITCTGMKQPADYLEHMEKRKRISHFALEGNALKAIELTEQLAQDILENNKDLQFDLLSLHFVELVCSRKCTEALEFAQTRLSPFGREEKYMEKLRDFMALVAFEEPEKSPVFHLLSLEYRQQVADNLNRAILAHLNLPSYTAMERLIQQATVVRQYLSQEVGKDGPPPFSLKDFLKS